MLGRIQFRFEKVRNVVMYDDKFKNFRKIIENICGPLISNRGSFSFFENRDNSCLVPQAGKSILRWTEIKNKLGNRHNNFRVALYNKIRYTVKSD
jgi:hypothetical protein